MNNQDYKQKKRECWEEFIGNDGFPTETMRQCFNYAFNRAYTLGKQFGNSEQVDVEKAAKRFADEIRIPASSPGVLVPFINGLAHDAYLQGAQDCLGKQESKQESKQETVIQGWVCRDKTGLLNFFYGGSVPYRNENDGDWNTLCGRVLEWLPKELFPDLTWESEPIEVELIIKRKKNG